MSRPKKQTVDYFPHPVNNGTRMFIMEQRYKDKGYCCYYKLLELLGRTDGHFIDFSINKNLIYFSAYLNTNESIIIEMMDTLSELGTIDKNLWNEKRIVWCQEFVDNLMDLYNRRKLPAPSKEYISREYVSINPEDGNKYTHDVSINPEDGNKYTHDVSINPHSKVNESKVNESKVNESKVNESKVNNSQDAEIKISAFTEKSISINPEKQKEKKYGAKKEKITDALYKPMIEIYFDFVKLKVGAPPKIDGAEGNAMKSIIKYLRSINSDEEKVKDAWNAIFVNFDKWDKFHQGQMKLTQINSNLINIINFIQNGHPNKQRPTKADYIAEYRKRSSAPAIDNSTGG